MTASRTLHPDLPQRPARTAERSHSPKYLGARVSVIATIAKGASGEIRIAVLERGGAPVAVSIAHFRADGGRGATNIFVGSGLDALEEAVASARAIEAKR